MRSLVRKFDAAAGKAVGRLPESWYKSLGVLCVIVSPPGWAVAMLVGAGLAWVNELYSLVWLSILMIIALPITELIKMVVRRPRPLSIYVETMRLRSYSFPSSHAYAASLGGSYALVCISQFMSGTGLYALAVLLVGLAVLVSVARVYLKAHFPSDVLAGLLIGLGVATLLTVGVL